MSNFTQLKHVMGADDSEWFTVRGKITQLKPKKDIHDKMAQEGYLSDGTAEIRFVDWGDAPKFEEGDIYEFESIVTNKYRGNISISITSSTQFKEITDNDLFDGKPREQIIREVEQMGPKNKSHVDTLKYEVSVEDLKKDSSNLEKPLYYIYCNLSESTPFWKKNISNWNLIPPIGTSMRYHHLSLYGINSTNEIVVGRKGSLGGITGTVGGSRKNYEEVMKLKEFADNTSGLKTIEYNSSILWMNLANCNNCGFEVDEVKNLIGVNPYNPSETYLSYYDWWKDTERHNIDVPECPECGEKELEPPETPNKWCFKQKIPMSENYTVHDVEDKIGNALDFDATIRFTRDKILSLTMNNIVMDLSNEIQNSISDKRTKATGNRGVRGINRRYIRLQFNRSLTEDELIEIADCAIKNGEGIGRIKKDSVNRMIIDLTFHENKSS